MSKGEFNSNCIVCNKPGEMAYSYPVPDGKGGTIHEVMVVCNADKSIADGHVKGMGLIPEAGYRVENLKKEV